MYLVAASLFSLSGCSERSEKTVQTTTPLATYNKEYLQKGKALFKEFCQNCHPDGGNVTDPAKTLYGRSLHKNGIYNQLDIVRIMRKPVSRMLQFDSNIISDEDAYLIADFILYTYK
ncbi:MAG: c-type cytochrome [Desulfuromonadaceae bacterium]|nr:c-type cytochrome [Desulfuromonadaceae bacterium]